jgi:hypothetical protein
MVSACIAAALCCSVSAKGAVAAHRFDGPWTTEMDETRQRGAPPVGGFLDLVGVLAGVAVTEVSLSALEVVVGALPAHRFAPVARRLSQGVAGVGDGVVEAVGLDACGGLLPGAASARLVRESAQRRREVGSRSFEHEA